MSAFPEASCLLVTYRHRLDGPVMPKGEWRRVTRKLRNAPALSEVTLREVYGYPPSRRVRLRRWARRSLS